MMSEISPKPLTVLSGHIAHGAESHHINVDSHHHDEIDLIELILRLWESKGLILMVTLVTTLMAGIYAFTAKEQWTVKAYVSPPKMVQFEDYLQLRRAFAHVSGDKVDPQAIANHIFNRFTEMVASPNEKRAYLLQTAYVKQQTESMESQGKRVWLTEMADKGLTVSSPDEKKTLPYFMLSVSLDNLQIAQTLLSDYVNRINDQVIAQDDAEFLNHVKAMILVRQKEQQDIDFSLHADRTNQLVNLNRSSNTAQLAGIKDYYVNSSSNGGPRLSWRIRCINTCWVKTI